MRLTERSVNPVSLARPTADNKPLFRNNSKITCSLLDSFTLSFTLLFTLSFTVSFESVPEPN